MKEKNHQKSKYNIKNNNNLSLIYYAKDVSESC